MTDKIIELSNVWYLISNDTKKTISKQVQDLAITYNNKTLDVEKAVISLGNINTNNLNLGNDSTGMTALTTSEINNIFSINTPGTGASFIKNSNISYDTKNWCNIIDIQDGSLNYPHGMWILTKEIDISNINNLDNHYPKNTPFIDTENSWYLIGNDPSYTIIENIRNLAIIDLSYYIDPLGDVTKDYSANNIIDISEVFISLGNGSSYVNQNTNGINTLTTSEINNLINNDKSILSAYRQGYGRQFRNYDWCNITDYLTGSLNYSLGLWILTKKNINPYKLIFRYYRKSGNIDLICGNNCAGFTLRFNDNITINPNLGYFSNIPQHIGTYYTNPGFFELIKGPSAITGYNNVVLGNFPDNINKLSSFFGINEKNLTLLSAEASDTFGTSITNLCRVENIN